MGLLVAGNPNLGSTPKLSYKEMGTPANLVKWKEANCTYERDAQQEDDFYRGRRPPLTLSRAIVSRETTVSFSTAGRLCQ